MRDHAARRGAVAIQQLGVVGQRRGQRAHAVGHVAIAAGAEPFHCCEAQRAQPAAAAVLGQHAAQLAFQRMRVVTEPIGVGLIGEAGERGIDHGGERTHGSRIGAAGQQHQREVVAQCGEVTMPGEQRRAQRQAIDGTKADFRLLPGEIESDLCVVCGLHENLALVFRAHDRFRPGPVDRRPARW